MPGLLGGCRTRHGKITDFTLCSVHAHLDRIQFTRVSIQHVRHRVERICTSVCLEFASFACKLTDLPSQFVKLRCQSTCTAFNFTIRLPSACIVLCAKLQHIL